MGTSVFADLFQYKFENLGDKDFLSIHVDDFLGVPWDNFKNGTPPPAAWAAKWEALASSAAASGKILYLSVSPLSGRKTLTDRVLSNGTTQGGWAPVDVDGCYPFATDPDAEANKQAYIRYCQYVIDLVRPTYFTPAIEMSVQFTKCPLQKAAFKNWYADVYASLKKANPKLILFPTYQFEHMYGLAEPAAWCGGTRTDASIAACFQQRLEEAAQLPGDRIAFSIYPYLWKYTPTLPDNYSTTVPYEDAFARVKRTTHKKIWISETGWPGVDVYDAYAHASPASSCGLNIIPSPALAGEGNLATHMSQLLAQAQAKEFEAVVWWSNRDQLDKTLAAACPCAVSTDTTCSWSETFYQSGGGGAAGSVVEFLWRINGNTGLRYRDGTPKPVIHALWSSYLSQPLATPTSPKTIQAYPNPFRAGGGDAAINLTDVPPNARLRIYTLNGELVKELEANALGFTAWDATDRNHKPVPSGVYYVNADGGGETKTTKVVVQR